MRPTTIAFASVMALGWAAAAAAGVVIKGQETGTHIGPRPDVTSTLYTATIEGKQEGSIWEELSILSSTSQRARSLC